MSESKISVSGRFIGHGYPAFVIAEAGVNHNGEVRLARRLVDVAAAAGADAVKFQTFDPAALVSATAQMAAYQRVNTASDLTQLAMLEALTLSPDAHRELKTYAEGRGLLFLSSPFDEGSADFLVELGVPALKVPSGELTNHPFLAHLASKGRPLLISSGMATLAEVADALKVVSSAGCRDVALFHCVSTYPAAPEDCNLAAIATMKREFGIPVGWSDHTSGITASVAAVALGADIIEKHLTLDHDMPGPDHRASADPAELAAMIAAIRDVEKALGDGLKMPRPSEDDTRRVARKSLHWRRSLEAGAVVGREDLVALRPGTGIAPSAMEQVIGRRVARSVAAGSIVDASELAPAEHAGAGPTE